MNLIIKLFEIIILRPYVAYIAGMVITTLHIILPLFNGVGMGILAAISILVAGAMVAFFMSHTTALFLHVMKILRDETVDKLASSSELHQQLEEYEYYSTFVSPSYMLLLTLTGVCFIGLALLADLQYVAAIGAITMAMHLFVHVSLRIVNKRIMKANTIVSLSTPNTQHLGKINYVRRI